VLVVLILQLLKHLSSNQTVAVSTHVLVQFNSEDFDTDNCFDSTTNYRFTPNVAGKYFVYGQIYGDVQTLSEWNYTNTQIRKNGSITQSGTIDNRNNPGREGSVFMATTMIMLMVLQIMLSYGVKFMHKMVLV
jgi:hypothetical protein